MKQVTISILILLAATGDQLHAQTGTFCATPSAAPDILQTIPQSEFKSSSDTYVVRVFIYIMRRSDGSGGQTPQAVNNALNILTGDFEQHGICLSFLGTEEIYDDGLYDDASSFSDLDVNGKFDHLQSYSHSNAVDIYLYANDKLNFGVASGIPGTAFAIGGVLEGSNLVNSSALSHEFGHCLGLYHTFLGLCEALGTCDELVDGTNCETCGDFV